MLKHAGNLLIIVPSLVAGGGSRVVIAVAKGLNREYGWKNIYCVQGSHVPSNQTDWSPRLRPHCRAIVTLTDPEALVKFIERHRISLIWGIGASLFWRSIESIKHACPHVHIVDQHFNHVHLEKHRRLAQHISHVVTCYPALAEQVQTPASTVWVGVPEKEKVHRLEFRAWKEKHQLRGLKPIVAFIGRFSPEKRPQWLVDIALQCKEVATVVAAGEGELYDQVVQDNQEREGGVVFLGQMEEPRFLYQCARVVIIPSAIEGLPNTMMEAIQFKRHVIITPVGGVPEWKHHPLVHVCEHSPRTFSDMVKQVIDAPAKSNCTFPDAWKMETMVAGYERVFSHFLPELMECVHYINLDRRRDRNAEFLSELKRYQAVSPRVQVNRFRAIECSRGEIGCGMSHLQVLKDCWAECEQGTQEKWFTLMEDDFCWKMDPAAVKESLDMLVRSQAGWDVILFTASEWGFQCASEPCVKTRVGGFHKVSEAATTTGYIVKSAYLPVLIENFQAAVDGLINGGAYHTFAIDQFWKRLQKKDTWLFHRPGFARQSESFSDIEKKVVNYNFY